MGDYWISFLVGAAGSVFAAILARIYVWIYDWRKTVKIADAMNEALQKLAGGGWDQLEKTFSIQIYNSTQWSLFIRSVAVTALAENGSSTDFPCRYAGEHSPTRKDWVALPPKKGDFWSSSLPLKREITGGFIEYDFATVFGSRRIQRVVLSKEQIAHLMQQRRTAHRQPKDIPGMIPVAACSSGKADE